MPHVIHFVDLEEMIPELEEKPIRMSTVAVPVGQYSDMPDAVRVRTYLYVRQITPQNIVLSWCMPIGEIIDMIRGQPMDAMQEAKADAVWEQADTIENLVRQRIKMENEEFDIRAGIISIGSDEAITGYWSELESPEFQVLDRYSEERAKADKPEPDPEEEIPF